MFKKCLKKTVYPALATTLMTFGVAASAVAADEQSYTGSAEIKLVIEKTNIASVPGFTFSFKTVGNSSNYQANIDGLDTKNHDLPDFSFEATPTDGFKHADYKTLRLIANLDSDSQKLNLSNGGVDQYLEMTHKIQKSDNPTDFIPLTPALGQEIVSKTEVGGLKIAGQRFVRTIKTTIKPGPGKESFSNMPFGQYQGSVKLIISAKWSDTV